MRIVFRKEVSSRRNVTSGVPQWSVLASIMFQCGMSSYINLYADVAKLMRVVKNTDDKSYKVIWTRSINGVRGGSWILMQRNAI